MRLAFVASLTVLTAAPVWAGGSGDFRDIALANGGHLHRRFPGTSQVGRKARLQESPRERPESAPLGVSPVREPGAGFQRDARFATGPDRSQQNSPFPISLVLNCESLRWTGVVSVLFNRSYGNRWLLQLLAGG